MITLLKYQKGCHREKDQDSFSLIPKERTRNNGFKLLEDRFKLLDLNYWKTEY